MVELTLNRITLLKVGTGHATVTRFLVSAFYLILSLEFLIHLLTSKASLTTSCYSPFQLKRRVVSIDGYIDVPPNNEQELLQAVAAQPVSVGICGSERGFQLYSGVGASIKFHHILLNSR